MTVGRTTRTVDVRNEDCVLAKAAVHSAVLRSKGSICYLQSQRKAFAHTQVIVRHPAQSRLGLTV